MARTRPARPPDPNAVAAARARILASRKVRIPRAPQVKHVPQVKAHKLPVTVVRKTRAIEGRGKVSVVSRIEVKLPKIPQVKAHHLDVRTVMSKARPHHPSRPIVVGLAKMPKVPQVKPHTLPTVIDYK